ncbi:type IV toxin-antitoxin system AbiEi family antitoxin domain-containing protein [Schleiferilactobacillus harbinensis]|uniref:Transcriptional regulator n=1 Tax=Schleiferilactobacillus harbinensis TaxID=304207 RepID=A0A510TTJ2_9LACO|nr:transcriptional regulator [Schleiferilactobacillus harbinensis]QFR24710.1 transcriptional regulator [Schleiferilactobacillus harbinensis]GEK05579.1 transcriptional regulator [Schleiferilactobacillus harbinensis]
MTRNIDRLLAEYSTFTAGTASRCGVSSSMLQTAMMDNKIVREANGVYVVVGTETDEYSLLSQKFSRGVFSQETALILHGLTTEMPLTFQMTFPRGYNNSDLDKWRVSARHLIPERYALGIETIQSPSGDPIKVYDPERTLLDIWNDPDIGSNIKYEAVDNYLASHPGIEENLRMEKYAEMLHSASDLFTVMAVLDR